jgi:hypothetical protein
VQTRNRFRAGTLDAEVKSRGGARVWEALRTHLKDLDDYLIAVGQAVEEAL